ncbi:MAG: AraC family transcriptional regulator [Prevotella sp.]|nr:AraC family transcriptional regulator [Prevotella sp.]
MNDTEHYGRYSVEGISNDVGFRSRTSFTTSFKRVTGLTPTEYMRIQNAQKQQKVGQ